MIAINAHEWKDIGFDIIVGCSIAHSVLPPWDNDALKPFPRLQGGYRLFIYVVGYIGLNARSTIYKSISVNNPDGVNGNGASKP
jgi:hypothetical protein